MEGLGDSASTPYDGLKIVECADSIPGEFLGKLLAEMGADVVKVEPPEGSPTRRIGPFRAGHDGLEESLSFWYYNRNKRSVLLEDSRLTLQELLSASDVLISTRGMTDLIEIGLDETGNYEKNPSLIIVSITAFGLTGPWRDYKSSDLVALAAGGPLHMCGYDDQSIPPIRPGGNQGFHTATSFAHTGLLLALLERDRTGFGQLVDVSMHEALAVTVEAANPYWFYSKTPVHRQTCRHAQPEPTQPALFEAIDGYLYFLLVTTDPRSWEQIVSWLESAGMEADLRDSKYEDSEFRQQQSAHIQDLIECFFLVNDVETLYREGQNRGLAIGKLNAPEDLLNDPHLRDRNFFVRIQHDEEDSFEYPGAPYRFSSFAPAAPLRAPLFGEHTQDVVDRAAGVSESEPG